MVGEKICVHPYSCVTTNALFLTYRLFRLYLPSPLIVSNPSVLSSLCFVSLLLRSFLSSSYLSCGFFDLFDFSLIPVCSGLHSPPCDKIRHLHILEIAEKGRVSHQFRSIACSFCRGICVFWLNCESQRKPKESAKVSIKMNIRMSRN